MSSGGRLLGVVHSPLEASIGYEPHESDHDIHSARKQRLRESRRNRGCVQHQRELALGITTQGAGERGALPMMGAQGIVMTMAITPSLKASTRPFPTPTPFHG